MPHRPTPETSLSATASSPPIIPKHSPPWKPRVERWMLTPSQPCFFTRGKTSAILRRMIRLLKVAVAVVLAPFFLTTLTGVTSADDSVDPVHQAIDAAVARVKPAL